MLARIRCNRHAGRFGSCIEIPRLWPQPVRMHRRVRPSVADYMTRRETPSTLPATVSKVSFTSWLNGGAALWNKS